MIGLAASIAMPALAARRRALRVLLDADAASIGFAADDGSAGGYGVELLQRLAGDAGLVLAPALALPWPDALASFAARDAELLIAAIGRPLPPPPRLLSPPWPATPGHQGRFVLQAALGAEATALDAALAALPPAWLAGLQRRWLAAPDRDAAMGWPLLAATAGAGAALWITRLRRELQRRRDAERSITASRDELALAAGNRQRFIGFLSHEARTLVATMSGGLELIADDAADPTLRRRIIDALRANAGGLKQLLDETLDASAIDAGALRVRLRPVRVACVLAQLRREAMPPAAVRGLQLDVDARGAAGLMALADPLRLAQALRNLVGNALKYTRSGGVRVAAALHAGRCDGAAACIVIEVADTGEGLDAEQLARLFKPYTRLADAGEGTGLGLAISRELVARMHGALTARSTPGQGSVFTIELPAAGAAGAEGCSAAARSAPLLARG